jgi:lysophospholipid acyltransferase (LPLAT)-like uncharacterized protein
MNLGKEIKYYLLNNFLTSLAYQICKLHVKTIRITIVGEEVIREHIEKGGMVIFASWHQRFYGGFYVPRILKMTPCIMISASRDGDFVSAVVDRIGWIPIRGSSSRRGKEALKEMIEGVKTYRVGGHIVDGPQGPPRVIKAGLITLAQQTGAAIAPAYVSYENPLVFGSWDRFMVPKPFSRVLMRVGPLEYIPQEPLSDDQFEKIRLDIEEKMIRGYAEADSYWKQ